MELRMKREGIFEVPPKGKPKQITNFTAEIIREEITVDGDDTTIVYTVVGALEGTKLPEVKVPAEKLDGLKWVNEWGFGPLIYPISMARELAALAIRVNSKAVKRTRAYGSTGWSSTADGHDCFVLGNKAVTSEGVIDVVSDLPQELSVYSACEGKVHDSVWSLCGLDVAGYCGIVGTLYAFRSALGGVDFGLHVAGRSGSFKSELAACFCSWFGPFTGRNLPVGWSSTANAIEALCHKAKDVPIVIDDYVPQGSAFAVRQLQAASDRVFRGLGNQQGRSRMSDSAALRGTYFPRGGVISTGEDVPEGHSVRGRLIALECTKGSLSSSTLTGLQKLAPERHETMCAFIQKVAGVKDEVVSRLRACQAQMRPMYAGIGHARTPDMLASLSAVYEVMTELGFSVKAGRTVMTSSDLKAILTACGADQAQYLTSTDLAEMSIDAIRQGFLAHKCHLLDSDGREPALSPQVGWNPAGSSGDYKPCGDLVGWSSRNRKMVYLDPDLAWRFVKKFTGGAVAVTRQTWVKRLVESGVVAERDEKNRRNVIRVTLGRVSRSVVAIDWATFGIEEDSVSDPDEESNYF